MGIVIAPIQRVREALNRELDSINAEMHTSTERKIDWSVFFIEDGLNYNVFNTEMILFEACNNLTIYTANSADGWWTIYSNMIETSSFDGYFFSRTIKNEIGYHGFQMKIWKSGIIERHVRALKAEDGWEFLNKGNIAAFENAKLYKKRKIAERLNQEVIESYSKAAGFPISAIVEYKGSVIHFYRP